MIHDSVAPGEGGLELPPPPQVPPRPPLPVVAAAAPVVAALVLWLVTGSAYVLLFAALGPIMAGASAVDGLIRRRRGRRGERARYLAALDRLEELIGARHERDRAGDEARVPRADDPLGAQAIAEAWAASGGRATSGPVEARLGVADRASGVRLTGREPEDADAGVAERVAAVRAAAGVRTATPLVADVTGGIGIVGPTRAARAVARGVVLDALAALSPRDVAVAAPEAEWDWVCALPHRALARPGAAVELIRGDGNPSLRVAWSHDTAALGTGCAVLVRIPGEAPAEILRAPDAASVRGWHPRFVSLVEAQRTAGRYERLAAAHGIVPAGGGLPVHTTFAELEAPVPPGPGTGLAAPVGRDADGPVVLDVVRDGPHALVAGTTGSGKSELLITWVLSLADSYPPSRVGFLLVDFKGGSSFAPLAGLPHVVATLSDLDARRSRRAMESLRAELQRRERLLADHGARGIEELAPGVLARLIVVVDEYAAVVADHPGLHDVFGDLAARGRSLGLHLVLCTQRPAGVVRDAILANVTLRIALRVTDRADSLAMLGSDGAARLPPEPRGRAIVADGSAEPRTVQVALADAADVARVAARTPADRSPAQPWCDALPHRLPIADLERLVAEQADLRAGADDSADRDEGIVLGLADLPAQQRWMRLRHRPDRDGHLVVLGGPRSGKSTALALLAQGAGERAVVVPPEPADAWPVIERLLDGDDRRETDGGQLVIADDVDVLVARAGIDHATELADRLIRLAREAPGRGLGLAFSAVRLGGPLHALGALVDGRILLRQPDREAYLLAGGDPRDHAPELPPGAGSWRGLAVQLALPEDPARDVLDAVARRAPVRVPRIAPEPGRPLAVASTRARSLAARWRSAGVDVVDVAAAGPDTGDPAGGHDPLRIADGRRVLVGDPDAWHAAWSLLAAARRELPLVIDRATPAELRALSRTRGVPPPLGPGADECWVVDDGTVRRAVLVVP